MGGDDHGPAAGPGVLDGRQQVGEGLAGAGRRLDQPPASGTQRACYLTGHFHLLAAGSAGSAHQGSALAEHGGDGLRVELAGERAAPGPIGRRHSVLQRDRLRRRCHETRPRVASGGQHPALQTTRWRSATEPTQQRRQYKVQQASVVQCTVLLPRIVAEQVAGQFVETAAHRRAAAVNVGDDALPRSRERQVHKLQGIEPAHLRNRDSDLGPGRFEQWEVVSQSVVGDHRPPVHEVVQGPQGVGRQGRRGEFAVGQSGELASEVPEPSSRTDQRLECTDLGAAGHQHGADLDDLVLGPVRPVSIGLQIEHYELNVRQNHISIPAPGPRRGSTLDEVGPARTVGACRGCSSRCGRQTMWSGSLSLSRGRPWTDCAGPPRSGCMSP